MYIYSKCVINTLPNQLEDIMGFEIWLIMTGSGLMTIMGIVMTVANEVTKGKFAEDDIITKSPPCFIAGGLTLMILGTLMTHEQILSATDYKSLWTLGMVGICMTLICVWWVIKPVKKPFTN
jgi:hypothetical protein